MWEGWAFLSRRTVLDGQAGYRSSERARSWVAVSLYKTHTRSFEYPNAPKTPPNGASFFRNVIG